MISNKAFLLTQGHRAYGTPIRYYYDIFLYYPSHSVKSFRDAINRAIVKVILRPASEDAKILLSGSNLTYIFCFCFLSRYLEILTKSRAACSYRQAKESAVKCLSQGQNNVSSFRTASVSIAFAIAFTQSVTLLTFYNEYEITPGVGKIF